MVIILIARIFTSSYRETGSSGSAAFLAGRGQLWRRAQRLPNFARGAAVVTAVLVRLAGNAHAPSVGVWPIAADLVRQIAVIITARGRVVYGARGAPGGETTAARRRLRADETAGQLARPLLWIWKGCPALWSPTVSLELSPTVGPSPAVSAAPEATRSAPRTIATAARLRR